MTETLEDTVIKAIEAIQTNDIPEKWWHTSDPWQLTMNFKCFYQELDTLLVLLDFGIHEAFCWLKNYEPGSRSYKSAKSIRIMKWYRTAVSEAPNSLLLRKYLIHDDRLSLPQLIEDLEFVLNDSHPKKNRPVFISSLRIAYDQWIKYVKRVVSIEDHRSPTLWKHKNVLLFWHTRILEIEQVKSEKEYHNAELG